jgi:hypothetical protein
VNKDEGCTRGYSDLALSEPAFIKNEEHVIRSQNDLVNPEFIISNALINNYY